MCVGYRALVQPLFGMVVPAKCEHTLPELPITLGLGMAAFKGFQYVSSTPKDIPIRVRIALTYQNQHARWLAIECSKGFVDDRVGHTKFLRDPDTCVACFVRDASKFYGNLLLTL